jgi:hypothetical protein
MGSDQTGVRAITINTTQRTAADAKGRGASADAYYTRSNLHWPLVERRQRVDDVNHR